MSFFPEGMPLPVTTAPPGNGFWEHAKKHELVVQKCSDCGNYQHPPELICGQCHSFNYEWEKVSGKGTVYSYMITHNPPMPILKDKVPFNTVMVELEDANHLRMYGNLIDGTPHEEIKIGMPVEVTWEDVAEDVSLPQWKRATPQRKRAT